MQPQELGSPHSHCGGEDERELVRLSVQHPQHHPMHAMAASEFGFVWLVRELSYW